MIVELCIILIDLLFTTLITLFCIPVGRGYHYFAPFLLLIAGYIVGMIIMWCVLSAFTLVVSKKKKYVKPMKWANFWLTEAISYIDIHSGARMKITYKEPLPNERYLLVCNHLSKFDPMLLTKVYGHKGLSFISKPTNFKIPIGGRFMRGACYLSIDRFDKLQSLSIMNDAAELIKNNYTSVGVFPEGTRSLDGSLGQFHEGVFQIAKKANCPIVIATISGTENIHKNFPFKPTKVNLIIHKVLYPNEHNVMIAKQISDYARNIMFEELKK